MTSPELVLDYEELDLSFLDSATGTADPSDDTLFSHKVGDKVAAGSSSQKATGSDVFGSSKALFSEDDSRKPAAYLTSESTGSLKSECTNFEATLDDAIKVSALAPPLPPLNYTKTTASLNDKLESNSETATSSTNPACDFSSLNPKPDSTDYCWEPIPLAKIGAASSLTWAKSAASCSLGATAPNAGSGATDATHCSDNDFATGRAFVQFPWNCIIIKSSKKYEDVNLLTRLYRRHTNGRSVTGNMEKCKVEEVILEELHDIVQHDNCGLSVGDSALGRVSNVKPLWISSSTDPKDRLSDKTITVNGTLYFQASEKAVKKSIAERNTKQTFHRPINQKTIEHAKDQADWLLRQKPELRPQLGEFLKGVMEIASSMAGKEYFRDTWEEQYINTINKVWNKLPKPDTKKSSSRKNKKSQDCAVSPKKQRKQDSDPAASDQVGDAHKDSSASAAAA